MTGAHAHLFDELAEAVDPHPLLHRLRREDPVHFVAAHQFWFVTGHAHVMRLLHDPEHVTLDGRVWESYSRRRREPSPGGCTTTGS